MSRWPTDLRGHRRVGEAFAWGGAAAIVTGAHIAAAALILAPEPPALDPGVEEALLIELGPEMFAAPEDMVSDLPPDVPMEQSIDAPMAPEELDVPELAEEAPPTEPVEQALLEPPPDMPPPPDTPPRAELPPEEPPEEIPEPLESPTPPEVALPEPVPPPPPRPVEQKTRTATKPPAAQTSAPPKVDAPKREAAAAPRAAVGTTADPREQQRWVDKANGVVARHMRRWRNPGKTVTLQMMVTIDASGRVVRVSVRGSTGDPKADATLQQHASRLPNLPSPPSGAGGTFGVPLVLEKR